MSDNNHHTKSKGRDDDKKGESEERGAVVQSSGKDVVKEEEYNRRTPDVRAKAGKKREKIDWNASLPSLLSSANKITRYTAVSFRNFIFETRNKRKTGSTLQRRR